MMFLRTRKITTALLVTVAAFAAGSTQQWAAQLKDEKRTVDAPKKDPVAVEKERLKGNWRIVSIETEGFQAPKPKEEEKRLATFTGKKWKTGQDWGFSYQLDPSTNPKGMDLKLEDDAKLTIQGIYELKGDELKVCVCLAEWITSGKQQRPTVFSTKAGSNTMLFVLRRQKS